MKVILLGLLTTLSAFCALGQKYKPEEFQASLLQAKYGALLVYNGQRNSFSLKFVSKSFEPTDKPNFVRVDNLLMQSSIIPFTQKLDFDNLDDKTQKQLLTGWKKYEKGWIEEQLKQTVNDKEEILKMGNRSVLYWVYDMPKDNETLDKQVYLVCICFDQMLILSGPVEKGKSESLLRDKFIAIAKTLEVNPRQLQDIGKLYKELMK
jgi:hypothetical protein